MLLEILNLTAGGDEWGEIKNPIMLYLNISVLGILQARILEWVAFPFSSGSFQPRNRTGVSCIAGGFFTNWAIRKPNNMKSQFITLDSWLHPLKELRSRDIQQYWAHWVPTSYFPGVSPAPATVFCAHACVDIEKVRKICTKEFAVTVE